MIILIRSNDANPDPRLQKYINYLVKTKQKYKVIAWNRGDRIIEKENYIYFNKQAAFGLGYKNIFKKFQWFIFVFFQLVKNKNDYKIIHACDLDTALPAYVIKVLTSKKLVFDIFDWMSSEENSGFLSRIISKIENQIFKNADYTILCEEYRINQIKEGARRESLILPNIPDLYYEKDSRIEEIIKQQHKKYKITLSYVGIFDRNRGIEDILAIVSNNKDVCLNIAGFGYNEELVKKMSLNYDNIIYWGKVDYNTGLNIMDNSDLIMAMYYLTNKVHKFAAPNKYYEGLFLGKAIVTNEGTLLAEKIKANNTGYVIEEGISSLEQLLSKEIDFKDIVVKNSNSQLLWNKSFKNYTKEFMCNDYQKILK